MKQQDIKVGNVYTDGKRGLRRVTAEGPEYKGYKEQEETDCLQYAVLRSTAGSSSIVPRGTTPEGYPLAHSTRQSFAAWAKALVPEEQLEQKLAEIDAQRVRLTPRQAMLMRSFDGAEDLLRETWWGCVPQELATARACAEKGLLTIDGDPGRGDHFTVHLTHVGIKVVRLATLSNA
ncbi:hypothetical protein ACXIVK_27840 [Paraburkholderia caledonica]|jgi:hypothetical protein